MFHGPNFESYYGFENVCDTDIISNKNILFLNIRRQKFIKFQWHNVQIK